MPEKMRQLACEKVALFARAWIEIASEFTLTVTGNVALFARAWIEMDFTATTLCIATVALFARAWIEIINSGPLLYWMQVALFARAWIEIKHYDSPKGRRKKSPSLRGRGLKSFPSISIVSR